MLETIFARKAEFEIVAMELDDCHDVSELHGQRFSQPWNDGAFESLLLQPNVFGFVIRQTNTLMFAAAQRFRAGPRSSGRSGNPDDCRA